MDWHTIAAAVAWSAIGYAVYVVSMHKPTKVWWRR